MPRSRTSNESAGERGADKYRVQATISGRARFAFHRIQAEEGKDESGTLELIMTLLLERDEDLVERYGLSLQDYRNARSAGEEARPPLQFEAGKAAARQGPKPSEDQAGTEDVGNAGNGTEDPKS